MREVSRRAAESQAILSTETKEWHHRHVLDLDDFSRGEIEAVLDTARAMKEVLGREIKRVPTLRGKTVVTAFYEPSTRTRVSFELAAKNLSADVASISAQASSVEKGESLLDTVRTFQALGADILVLRHWQSGAPYFVAQHVEASIISAGDGSHAHPTQALLDLFTIRERMGSIEGLRVAIIGDIAYSRVARSNVWGLMAMGAQVVLCGPSTLLPSDIEKAYPDVIVETSSEAALEGADVVMALRLQRERQEAGLLPSLREYIRLYQLNSERLARARPGALVLHPGPMNEGLEISPEVAHGPQSAIEEQVTNGVAVRMALLYLLARGGHAED
ncbi:MAG: aspartate carbamoyltransferase catalytic subunit [Chloroflexi bacterium]|nr:aspartate carbamoyltransferase catalytic subunit [Chloroflexota bacterium]